MDKIYDKTIRTIRDMPESMRKFIEDIDLVCKKHNLSISHEDYHGAFIIEEYDKGNIKWLSHAYKNYEGND